MASNKSRLYLKTRVEGHTDYVNAVRSDSFLKQCAFIQTQVPLSHTVVDFWRLIHDHSVSTIVLLNKLDTATSYWPTEVHQTISCGPINIKLTQEESNQYEGIIIRTFHLSNEKDRSTKNKIIKQYHLVAWEDGKETFNNIEILKLLKYLIKRVTPPIVVQCMNSVDRSCLFITFHNLIEMIEASQPVDIDFNIKRLRTHRPQAIRTHSQYLTIFHWLLASYKSSDYYNM